MSWHARKCAQLRGAAHDDLGERPAKLMPRGRALMRNIWTMDGSAAAWYAGALQVTRRTRRLPAASAGGNQATGIRGAPSWPGWPLIRRCPTVTRSLTCPIAPAPFRRAPRAPCAPYPPSTRVIPHSALSVAPHTLHSHPGCPAHAAHRPHHAALIDRRQMRST